MAGRYGASLATAVDIYGSEAPNFVGMQANKSTAAAASGTIGSDADTGNGSAAFSWVGFMLVLVLIRVLEEFAPTR